MLKIINIFYENHDSFLALSH